MSSAVISKLKYFSNLEMIFNYNTGPHRVKNGTFLYKNNIKLNLNDYKLILLTNCEQKEIANKIVAKIKHISKRVELTFYDIFLMRAELTFLPNDYFKFYIFVIYRC